MNGLDGIKAFAARVEALCTQIIDVAGPRAQEIAPQLFDLRDEAADIVTGKQSSIHDDLLKKIDEALR